MKSTTPVVSTLVVALVAALLLAGCASAPEFKAPTLDVPAAYKETGTDAARDANWQPARPAEADARGAWWTVFGDADLNRIEVEAASANASLAAAAARVRQARALAGTAAADRIPQVNASAGPSRGRSAPVALGVPQSTYVPPGTTLQAGLSAGYEVDLFGRVAANVNAAEADAQASEATFKSVLLALQADVAQNWFTLRGLDAEVALLAETVSLRADNLRVTERRFALGDIGEVDVAQARSDLASTQSELLGAQRQRALIEHALAVLLGKPAPAFSAGVSPLPHDLALPRIPAGLPSALLERRPDVSAAQRAMIAANARIGVARAARFPSLRLTGSAGYESAELSDLFTWTSRTWLLGALLNLPVIDGGRNRANIERSEAVLEESVADYRQKVLVAFADVEDSLAGLRYLADQTTAIDTAVQSAQRAADLASKRYRAGEIGFLESLDTQRALLAAQRQAVQLRANRATTTVALVRALGGGW